MPLMTRFNRFAGDLFRGLGFEVRRVRRREQDSLQVQRLLCPKVDVIFDAGANIGQTAKAYRHHFPEAAIWSFEPFEESFRALETALPGDSRFHPVKLALSDRAKTAVLHVNQAAVTNSLLPTSKDATATLPSEMVKTVATIEIPVTSIDLFREEKGISRIDILKLDIQGSELLALEGARQTLEQKRVGLIYTEVVFSSLYEGQPSLLDLWSYLAQFGFRFHSLHDLNIGSNGTLNWADAIFVGPG